MYPLIPYKRFVIQTDLSCAQAADTLRQFVGPRRIGSRFWFRDTSDFQGEVLPDRFKIQRVIRYRNSFLPVLHGSFTTNGNETLIDVRMVVNPFVLACVLLLCSGVVIGIAKAVFVFLHDGVPDRRLLFLFFMLLFIYLLIFLGYGSEAEKSESMLKEIFSLTSQVGHPKHSSIEAN